MPLVEVKRQIESVVEEKGWREHEQLNQESSKGGGRFKNSPINLMEDPKKEKESPELKEALTEDELMGVDGGGEYPNQLSINNPPVPHTSPGPYKTPAKRSKELL